MKGTRSSVLLVLCAISASFISVCFCHIFLLTDKKGGLRPRDTRSYPGSRIDRTIGRYCALCPIVRKTTVVITASVSSGRRRPTAGQSESAIWSRAFVTIDEWTTTLPVEHVHVLVFLTKEVVSFSTKLVILLSVSRERKLIQLLVIISLAYFKWLFPFITAALPYLFLLACNISLNNDKSWKVRRRKPSIGDGRLFGRVPVGERKAYYVPAVPLSYILFWQFRGWCCLVRYIDFITPTWCIFCFPSFFHLGWTN